MKNSQKMETIQHAKNTQPIKSIQPQKIIQSFRAIIDSDTFHSVILFTANLFV